MQLQALQPPPLVNKPTYVPPCTILLPSARVISLPSTMFLRMHVTCVGALSASSTTNTMPDSRARTYVRMCRQTIVGLMMEKHKWHHLYHCPNGRESYVCIQRRLDMHHKSCDQATLTFPHPHSFTTCSEVEAHWRNLQLQYAMYVRLVMQYDTCPPSSAMYLRSTWGQQGGDTSEYQYMHQYTPTELWINYPEIKVLPMENLDRSLSHSALMVEVLVSVQYCPCLQQTENGQDLEIHRS